MQMIEVHSTSIAAIGYDQSLMVLRISFHNNGTYDYYGVPQQLFEQLIAAGSKGRFYAYFIKGRFKHCQFTFIHHYSCSPKC